MPIHKHWVCFLNAIKQVEYPSFLVKWTVSFVNCCQELNFLLHVQVIKVMLRVRDLLLLMQDVHYLNRVKASNLAIISKPNHLLWFPICELTIDIWSIFSIIIFWYSLHQLLVLSELSAPRLCCTSLYLWKGVPELFMHLSINYLFLSSNFFTP